MNQIFKLNDRVIFKYGRFWGIGIIAKNDDDYCPIIELIFVTSRILDPNMHHLGWKPDIDRKIDENYKSYNSSAYYLYVPQDDISLLND